MYCFVNCVSIPLVLLIKIANPFPENDSPLPDAFLSEPYFETAPSTTIDQFQTDLTLDQPGDYPDPEVIPYDWFLPSCKTPYTLCCTRLPLIDHISRLVTSMFARDAIVFGCSNCMPSLFSLHHASN